MDGRSFWPAFSSDAFYLIQDESDNLAQIRIIPCLNPKSMRYRTEMDSADAASFIFVARPFSPSSPSTDPQAPFIDFAGGRLGQFTDEVHRFRGLVVGDISLQKAMISSSVALWPSF